MENNKKYFFAVDLGATSGRTIIGTLDGGRFSLEELTRFDNNLIETGGHFYWDIYALYNEIIKGLKLAAQRQLPICSIGIDTWGVDFVCVGKDGALLRNPLAYRDPHTFGMMEEYFDKAIDKKTVYDTTGIQFMNFNSLFQLYAMRRAGNTALENAEKILFVPDALSYMLTGKMVCEYTIASTSQILDPKTKQLDERLLESVGLSRDNFGQMVNPAVLKNICGMWLYERCRKEWTDAPKSHAELQAEAMKQPAFQSIINPDDTMFANPASMVDAIQTYCRETGQHVPEGYAEICRCIFDSLALRYRQVFGYLKEMASFPLDVLHIIGGGSLNNYLNQFTADALGVEVLAGPQEGTDIGNIMLQAKAAGDVSDIWEMRRIIADSLELKRFEPKDKETWNKAYERFLEIVEKKK